MEADRARKYCDQLEAHMEAGGSVAANNVRDLIGFLLDADERADRAEAERDALRKERDEAREAADRATVIINCYADEQQKQLADVKYERARAEKAEARIRELEGALEPFGLTAGKFDQWPDDPKVTIHCHASDLRRARSLLTKGPAQDA